jgi:hypothetical protein
MKRSLSTGSQPLCLQVCTSKRRIRLPFASQALPLSNMTAQDRHRLFPPKVLQCTNPVHWAWGPRPRDDADADAGTGSSSNNNNTAYTSSTSTITGQQLGMALLLPVYKAMQYNLQQLALSAAEAQVGTQLWSTWSRHQQQCRATLGIFTNPAVKQSKDGRWWDACMTLKQTR